MLIDYYQEAAYVLQPKVSLIYGAKVNDRQGQ